MTTRGEKVCQFIERYCLIPEGSKVGQPIKLLDFQRKFVLDVYDNPAGTSRAYLSVARKNGKSALIAAIVLAHLVGPEAKQNSQIISGARSRDQASLVFKLANCLGSNFCSNQSMSISHLYRRELHQWNLYWWHQPQASKEIRTKR